MLDAYCTSVTWRVHELAGPRSAERDANVRRAPAGRGEEDQIARLDVRDRDVSALLILLGHCSRYVDVVLLEDVPDEAAAIEAARGILAAKLVAHALKRERVLHNRVRFGQRCRRKTRVVQRR